MRHFARRLVVEELRPLSRRDGDNPHRRADLRAVGLRRPSVPRVAVRAEGMCRDSAVDAARALAFLEKEGVPQRMPVPPSVCPEKYILPLPRRLGLGVRSVIESGDEAPRAPDMLCTPQVDQIALDGAATSQKDRTVWMDPRARVVAIVGGQRAVQERQPRPTQSARGVDVRAWVGRCFTAAAIAAAAAVRAVLAAVVLTRATANVHDREGSVAQLDWSGIVRLRGDGDIDVLIGAFGCLRDGVLDATVAAPVPETTAIGHRTGIEVIHVPVRQQVAAPCRQVWPHPVSLLNLGRQKGKRAAVVTTPRPVADAGGRHAHPIQRAVRIRRAVGRRGEHSEGRAHQQHLQRGGV